MLLRKVRSSIRMHLMYSLKAGSSHSSFTHVLARTTCSHTHWLAGASVCVRMCVCVIKYGTRTHLGLAELRPQFWKERQMKRKSFVGNQHT